MIAEPASKLRRGRSGKADRAGDGRADAFRIAHANFFRLRLKPVQQFRTATRRAGKAQLAAACLPVNRSMVARLRSKDRTPSHSRFRWGHRPETPTRLKLHAAAKSGWSTVPRTVAFRSRGRGNQFRVQGRNQRQVQPAANLQVPRIPCAHGENTQHFQARVAADKNGRCGYLRPCRRSTAPPERHWTATAPWPPRKVALSGPRPQFQL